jgi:hypothetical protein
MLQKCDASHCPSLPLHPSDHNNGSQIVLLLRDSSTATEAVTEMQKYGVQDPQSQEFPV